MKYIKVSDNLYEELKRQYDIEAIDHTLAENFEWLETNPMEIGQRMPWKDFFEEWKEDLKKALPEEQIKEMGEVDESGFSLLDLWAMKLCMWFEGVQANSFEFEIDDGEGDGWEGCLSEPDGISMSYYINYGS
jgi:hypothetical protein